GRKLEIEFINYCIREVNKEWNPREWRGEYIPTKKNHQVADLLENFGFSKKVMANGTKKYQADRKQLLQERVPFITVVEE
ncbi:unnamed protein product, partial [marine sediment metagenome]